MPRGCGFCQAGREGCASALFETRRAFLSSSLPTAGGLRRHVDLPLRTAFVKRAERGCKALHPLPLDRGAFFYAFMPFYIFAYICFCMFRRERPRARLLLQGPRPAHARGNPFQTAKNGRGFCLSRFSALFPPASLHAAARELRQSFCLRIQKLLKENLPEESNPYQSSPAVGVVKI